MNLGESERAWITSSPDYDSATFFPNPGTKGHFFIYAEICQGFNPFQITSTIGRQAAFLQSVVLTNESNQYLPLEREERLNMQLMLRVGSVTRVNCSAGSRAGARAEQVKIRFF